MAREISYIDVETTLPKLSENAKEVCGVTVVVPISDSHTFREACYEA